MSKDIIDRARAQFAKRRDLQGPILVPEWGIDDAPLEIFYKVMNMEERAKVFGQVQSDPFGSHVLMVILNSYDANGHRLFSMAERVALAKDADPDVIMRIANEMSAGTAELSEADMGN